MFTKKLIGGIFLFLCLFLITQIIYYQQNSITFLKQDSIPKFKTEERHENFARGKYNLKELKKKLDEKLKQATDKKIILFWTNNPGQSIQGNTNAKECGDCEVTSNRLKVDDPATKAVIFRRIDLRYGTFPKTRRLDQYYTWLNQESSATLHFYQDQLKKYDDVFNLTMTHRQDSDIWSPYGDIKSLMAALSEKQKTDQHIDEMIRNKQKRALWLVSNCKFTQGAVERMKYVKSLVRDGLDIDLGGKCFPKGIKEWRIEDYKFYFAFENSEHCRDYITEKYFENALMKGVVPVVFGPDKKDYELIGPPNSFIYAKDYSNKDLIKLLNYLNQNDTAYKEYFKWRQIPLEKFEESRRAASDCQLCRFIHGINYDSVFQTSLKTQQVPLFYESLPRKHVKSLSNWTFLEDNKACLEGAWTKFNKTKLQLLALTVVVSMFGFYKIHRSGCRFPSVFSSRL